MIVHVIQLNSENPNCNLLYLGLTADKVLNDLKEDILPRIEESDVAESFKAIWDIKGLEEWFQYNFCFYKVEYFTRSVK